MTPAPLRFRQPSPWVRYCTLAPSDASGTALAADAAKHSAASRAISIVNGVQIWIGKEKVKKFS